MNADDLQNLYSNLRGSRSAQVVLDAHELFVEKKMGDAFDKLAHARDMYQQSRSRLIRQPPARQVDAKAGNAAQQIKRIERKQQKAIELLETFEQLLSQLGKLAEREQQRILNETSGGDERDADTGASVDEPDREPERSEPKQQDEPLFATSSHVTRELSGAFRQASGEDQLDVISGSFDFREVKSPQDIYPGALYLIRTADRFSLACTLPADEISGTIQLEDAADDKPIRSYSRSAFVSLGTDRHMVLLTPKASRPAGDPNDEIAAEPDQTPGESAGSEPDDDEQRDREPGGGAVAHSVLDMGAFSQLMDSAQRSGMVPGSDQIAHVRDREFRMENYDRALQLIEAMFATFTANATQRNQRLTREDADISSGRIKMSPKQLQAKRSRDRMQTQAIERARNRFQRVLDGLRILLRSA